MGLSVGYLGATMMPSHRRPPHIISFLNGPDFGTFWPLNSRIRWTKWQLAVERPHQRLSKNQIPAPQDSHSGYFSIKICTYGCKWPAAKNEGMDEHQDSLEYCLIYPDLVPPK